MLNDELNAERKLRKELEEDYEKLFKNVCCLEPLHPKMEKLYAMPVPVLNEFVEVIKNYRNSILLKACEHREISQLIAMDSASYTCVKIIETIQGLMKTITEEQNKKVQTKKV